MRALNVELTVIAAVLVGPLILPVFTAKPAVAAGVVGTGDPMTCTEGALETALAGGGSVTFDCGPNPFTLTLTAPKTITVDTSLDGGGLITLSGGGTVQIFTVNTGVTMSIDNLTMSGGMGAPTLAGYGGGAIYNKGTLTATNSTFTDNRGTPSTLTGSCGAMYSGGAIYNDGTLNVINSTFSGNSANGGGGAIFEGRGDVVFNGGTLTVTNSTFTDNRGAPSKAPCPGGAILNEGTLTVTNSTFSGNSGGDGAAIYNWPGTGTVTVTNSTFSGNSAKGVGGAIDIPGTATVTNSTFSGNSAKGGSAIANGDTAIILNNIIANTAGGNCVGYIIGGGHNLLWPSTDTSCGGDFGDPKLSPLADNGGPTQTMALQSGSAAINAGDNTVCAASPVNNLDQRGFVRPGVGLPNCSIGAYEFNTGVSCDSGFCVFPPEVCTDGQCVTATPTPTGAIPTPTPNRPEVSCEKAVASNLTQLVVCIKKCHNKWADSASKGQSFEEEACEQGAGKPVSCRAKYEAASAKLVAKGTCPACLDASAQSNLAASMTSFFEGQISGQIYCKGSPP